MEARNMADHRLCAPILWAQRADKLYVTVNLSDCHEPTIKIEPTSLYFCGVGGPEKKEYECKIEFHGEVVPEESQYAVLPRHVPMIIRKKDEGPYWPRLLKSSQKVHWLKTDFGKWRDEDDSEAEDEKDMQFEDMMKQMGNFNAGGAGPPGVDMLGGDEEEDSDDEELPDLE